MKFMAPMYSNAIRVATMLTLLAISALGAPPVLRWNGASGGTWDAATANWLDAGSAAVAWQPGAEASFDGSGGIVNIAAELVVSNLTFTGSGYTLLGGGTLAIEGALFVAAGATNCVAAPIISGGGLSKTGAGLLALAQCGGALAVQSGTLLVSGSAFADADITVASGATLLTQGEPDNAANLILNPGFELPAMASGSWSYVANGNVISNWNVTASAQFTGRQNTAAAGSPWNSVGSSPEGVHMLIMQYDSTIAQSVTVPADGIYSIAFSYLLRRTYPENQIYVTLNGIPLATFLNRSVEFAPGRYASSALYLKAGSHTLGFSGEAHWEDRASMIDAVCFAPPSSVNASRALSGDSVLTVVTGAAVTLGHTGDLPLVYLAIDGTPATGTFNASHASGIFGGSGSLSCTAPGNVYTWNGTGLWSDSTLWIDGSAPPAGGSPELLIRFPDADEGAATNNLSGTFLCNRLTAAGITTGAAGALTGNPIALTNSSAGKGAAISFTATGAGIISAPLTAYAPLTLNIIGALTITDTPLTLPNGSTLSKTGSGTLTVPSITNNLGTINVYEGTLQTPALPSLGTVALLSRTGQNATLCLTQPGHTYANRITLRGSGRPTIATRAGGGTITGTDWIQGFGPTSSFDVDGDDTLSIRQLLNGYRNGAGGVVTASSLIKSGPGTMEIRSAGLDTLYNRAYMGGTILRNGTLILSEDDYGTLNGWTNPFNGRTYDGRGGSLGYNTLANDLIIGDSGTAATDELALIANGDGRWIGHDIEIMNRGSSVTLGMTTGTVMFAGTLTLHRDIILAGPSDGIMVLGDIVAAPDFSGTGVPVLSGLGGIVVEGAIPPEVSLLLEGRSLSFGTFTAKATTLNALVLGSASVSGALEVDFAPGLNDTIDVTMADGLVLSNTVVNLYYAGSGAPFAEPGTYTLLTYAGTLGGDIALLSVGNPQPGAGYVFSNDTANTQVMLTISNTSGGASVVWKNPGSGSWALGANWDTGSVPDAAGLTPLFGLAITTPATVTIDSARTAGGLSFNNALYGYTLTGGSLTLDDGGATPQIALNSGSHTLDTIVNGSDGLAVTTTADSALILTANAVLNTGLALTQGTVEMRTDATIAAPTALSSGTTLRSTGSGTLLTSLSGAESAVLELTGAAPGLTIDQSVQGVFAGALKGAAGATLIKSGAESLILSHPNSTYAGLTEIAGGTLVLQGTPLPGTVALGAAGTLAVQSPASDGLMGYYYNVAPNTNHFLSLAALEAHFAALTPDLISPSGAQNTTFDFGWSPSVLFPQPYGNGGSRTTNFEAVWRGTITVPQRGVYKFGVSCDDLLLLAVNGVTVLQRNYYAAGWSSGAVQLEAGAHDMVLCYGQASGGYGLRVQVTVPGSSAAVMLPNDWLTPYSSTGPLTGTGALAFTAADTALRLNGNSSAAYSGTVTAPTGTVLAKEGSGFLELCGSGANGFAGNLDVQAGTLALGSDNRIGDSAAVNIRSAATFAVAGADTIAALAGSGRVKLGNTVYFFDFVDDAGTGISPAKTYTHLLDFGTRSTPATVINGVTFNKTTAQNGTIGGYGWVNFPPTPHGGNVPPTVPPSSGAYNLLYDMNYGWKYPGTATMQLTGLIPGTRYEVRFYNRSWAVSPRVQIFTFDPDGAGPVSDAVTFNPDTAGSLPNVLAYRYTAVAATLDITIESLNLNHAYHLYGISNEVVPEPAGAVAALTLAPAAGAVHRFTGAISGNGTLTKAGAGTQIFSGINTLTQPLSVTAGTAVLEAGASVSSGASVASGAVLETSEGNLTLGGITGDGTFNAGSMLYLKRFTGDADCGISSNKTYTHLLDFGSNANKATVNGVAFNKVSATSGSISGFGWSGMPPNTHPGGEAASIAVSPFAGIYNLIYDMNYNLSDGTMYITGLTVGKWYELRLYNRRWSPIAFNRTQTLTFDPDGAGPRSDVFTFNPDSADPLPDDNYLGYRYLAASTQLAIKVKMIGTGTYHLYGLSNEEAYGAVTLDIAGSSLFGGTVTGSGALAKTGAGTLTFTGDNTASGPFAVTAGAFGVAGGGRATAGPVTVAAGAALFGDGLMGGRVTVLSNAVIHAGTASACGTLEIGDGAVVAPGALPRWRYEAGGNDTIAVNGLLIFPTNGVLQVASLTAGLMPPGKRAVFSSTQSILGPDDLTGWTVTGATNSTLVYSEDRTVIYFNRPSGTVILLR